MRLAADDSLAGAVEGSDEGMPEGSTSSGIIEATDSGTRVDVGRRVEVRVGIGRSDADAVDVGASTLARSGNKDRLLF